MIGAHARSDRDHAGGQPGAWRVRADAPAARADRRRAWRARSIARTSRRSRRPATASNSWTPTRRCPIRCSWRTWRSCSTSSRSSRIPAPSRAGGEMPAIAAALAAYRPLQADSAAGDRRRRRRAGGGPAACSSGRSTRTNDAALVQIRRILGPFGYTVTERRRPRLPAPEVGGHGACRRCAAREP